MERLEELVIRDPFPDEALVIQQIIAEGRRGSFNLSQQYLDDHYREMTTGLRLEERERSIRQFLGGDTRLLYRLAVVGKTAVGSLVSAYRLREEFHPSMPYPPEDTPAVCEMRSLYVIRRGQGIGTLLMREHDRWATESYPDAPSGMLVVSTNAGAIKLYEREGYRTRGRPFRWMNRPPEEESVSCTWMQRDPKPF